MADEQERTPPPAPSAPDARARPPAEEERRGLSLRAWVFLVVAVVVVLLGVANRQPVELRYLFGEADVRLVWVILGALVAGAVLDRTYAFVRRRRRRRQAEREAD